MDDDLEHNGREVFLKDLDGLKQSEELGLSTQGLSEEDLCAPLKSRRIWPADYALSMADRARKLIVHNFFRRKQLIFPA